MGEPTLMKKLVNETVDVIEDVATAIIGVLLLTFTMGAWYGSVYANQPQLWWPLWILVLVIVLKLMKDLLERKKKK